jgi:lipoprotein-releasing system permease protein
MQVSVGDRVLVTLPNGVVTYVQVAAVFKWGMTAIDNTQGFASVQTVQKLMLKNASYITDIYLKFVNPDEAPIKAEEWRAVFEETQIEDWKSTLAEIESTNKLRNMMTILVVVTLLTVSGFGIYNIQTMMIFERMKDIAILRAIGLQGNDIRLIFLIEALIIGLLGSILGLISGFLICYAVSKIPYHVDVVITIDHLPIQFKTIYYVSGFMFGIITTAIAGYFPSKRASKIDPVEIIRG